MVSRQKLEKNLQNAFKISGFNIRREFCSFIVDKLNEEGIALDEKIPFESCLNKICDSLVNQCVVERSIEKEHIVRAIEDCLCINRDRHETIFSVIDAFEFPKFNYDVDRKLYVIAKKKSTLLADADAKAKLFLERYSTILQRVQRNFIRTHSENEADQLKLETIDYLLTSAYITLDRTLILGSLLQVSEGKYHLEDPTGTVLLNLKHANFDKGFFVENTFVLITGYYEDRILHVSTMASPPGELHEHSRPSFGSLNYFGGPSSTPLRDSVSLKEHLYKNKYGMIMFLSDVWLDNPMVFEKLKILFEGLKNTPPIAFVFMGNFISEIYGNEGVGIMKRQFKELGELIVKFPRLANESDFVFIPGMNDPCTPHIVPRLPIPPCLTSELTKLLPNAVFTTNPCRIQYCTKEISVFRADLMTKLLEGTLRKPSKSDLPMSIAKTIIGQGHLSPMSLNASTVHWDFDYALRLYPLPDVIVIGDKSEPYQEEYKGCIVSNPGSFYDTGFQFKAYTPATNKIDDCMI